MYYTTGLERDQIVDLCIRISSLNVPEDEKNYPPSLGLMNSVIATLKYKRHNTSQAEIAEWFGVSQPTVSRAIQVITHLIAEATREFVPTAEDLDQDEQYLIDGTLLPCWSWKDHPELWSGKHKETGVNVQVACTIYGKLAWISDPISGNRHDSHCIKESGVLEVLNPADSIGDKGYVGNDMITPFKKPAGGELLDWQKEFNTAINKIRWKIEQVISHIKNWKILSTDYRRPYETFPDTISAVIGLQFFRIA
jgi:DDE superfamily endonuclease/Helix-turn-helix of DDE superfamily endonuclease